MDSRTKFLNAVKYSGLAVLAIGIILFSAGFYGSGYNLLISLGIGTVIGAVFIFLIGIFFAATEEMLEKTRKGMAPVPLKHKKGAPL